MNDTVLKDDVLKDFGDSGLEAKTSVKHQANRHMLEKGAPPGVGSIMWNSITDLSLMPIAFSVAVMQGALPAVSTAVEKTGTYKHDPVARARSSASSLMRFLYDGGDVAYQEVQDLRKLHANIKGTLADGSSYYALNPATFRIVPDTFLDGIIRNRELIGKPLNEDEKNTLFDEYLQLCLMFGIPRKFIGKDLEEFNAMYLDVVENQMEYTPAVKILLEQLYKAPTDSKGFILRTLGKAHNKYIAPIADIGLRGGLHPRYRELNGIPWTSNDQEKFQKLTSKIRFIQRVIPRPLRSSPLSYAVRMGFHGWDLPTPEEVKIKEQATLDRLKARAK